MFAHLKTQDPAIYDLIQKELCRQIDGIELIASENYVSPAVMETMGNFFTNKYAEGYPAHRYYGGCEYADEVETIAQDRLKAIFHSPHANVQPHSGAQANLSAYMALLNPGDKILGMSLAHGGHLSHGTKINASGKFYQSFTYGVDQQTETIDYDEVERIAKEVRPQLIVAGASAYPRTLDFARLRKIADEVGAKLLVDMAHIAGLVAANQHPSPIPYAHITTLTTHKTMRGPRGGAILCDETLAKAVDKAVFPGHQGGPLVHIIAAKAVAFGEALSEEFQTYGYQIVKNAAVLAEDLKERGYRLVSGGTDNHLILLDTMASLNITGKEAEQRLARVGITVNKNAIPFDPLPPVTTSGIRIGTPVVTTRGMKEEQMHTLSSIIDNALREQDLPQAIQAVKDLTRAFPFYDTFC